MLKIGKSQREVQRQLCREIVGEWMENRLSEKRIKEREEQIRTLQARGKSTGYKQLWAEGLATSDVSFQIKLSSIIEVALVKYSD